LPSRHGLFLTECSVSFDGHRQNPSWCFAVRMRPARPPAFAAPTIWSASKSVGSKTLSGSSPYPHSLSVNVFTVKWRKP